MLKENQKQLILQYKETKRPELKDDIIVTFKPLLHYIARKFAYHKDDFDDLVQVANIALLNCLDRYEVDKNIDFATFVTPNIIGEIKHYFRDKNRLIKVPRRLQELHSKIKTLIRDMQNQGKIPVLKELAETLEVSEELVLEAMEAGQNSQTVSLDTPSYLGDQSSVDTHMVNRLGVLSKEDSLLNKETLKNAIYQLEERERRIVFLRFYGGLSQTQIAERLGLSQMHISRLLIQSIKKLKIIISDTVI